MKAVQAHAVLNGRMVATVADLAPLAHCLWDEVEDAQVVQEAVDKLAAPDVGAARKLFNAAVAEYDKLPGKAADDSAYADAGAAASRKIRQLLKEAKGLQQSPKVADMVSKMEAMANEIVNEMNRRLGFDM
jgi:hypothetical protein